jgi:rhomboid family GlyGly-CTERM serine protease
LALPAFLPALWPGIAARLEYDRAQIAAGELWRAVTGHWMHWSLDHLLWDVGMLVLTAALCWRLGRGRTLAALGASAVAIPAALWFLSPDLERYRGLSGLDAALFVLLAAGLLRRELAAGRRRSVPLLAGLLLGFAGKVAYEAVTGATLFVDPGADFVPVPLAHLVGGVCGWAAGAAGSRTSPRPLRLILQQKTRMRNRDPAEAGAGASKKLTYRGI